MPIDVRINNVIYSWESCAFNIDGQPIEGIVSCDWAQKRERKRVHVARRDGKPVGYTAGKYTVDSFSLKMLRDSWDAVTDYLTIQGLGSYGDAEFTFQTQVLEPAVGSIVLTATASVCTVDGVKDGHEEGVDELLVEIDIGVSTIVENGKQLWSLQRGIAV